MFSYELFLFFLSKKLATCAYIFPNNHEIKIIPKIPKIIVIAVTPASFGP